MTDPQMKTETMNMTMDKTRVQYCDVRVVSHSCDVFTSEPLLTMVFHISTIGIDGFSNGFLPSNHCHRWFFNGHSLSCILALDDWDADGFEVWEPLDTMVLQCFLMVANHWFKDGMERIHRRGLIQSFDQWMENWVNTIHIIGLGSLMSHRNILQRIHSIKFTWH